MSFLVFDIETRVDKGLVRATRYRGLELTDEQAYERLRAELAEEGGGRDFAPLSYHVPVSIGLGTVDAEYLLTGVEVLRAEEVGLESIVRDFWARLEAHAGTLVSFNGRVFDLPVLELQGLRVGAAAPRYFGERDGFRGRYGRHLDLYDFLTNAGAARLRGGFDLVTRLIGLPGKTGVAGSDVQRLWEAGQFEAIHRYCRRDVIATYYLLLHVERLRGRLSSEALADLAARTHSFRRELEGD